MDESAKQASRIIDSVTTALANWIVARQIELDSELEQRYGADWRSDWVKHVESQLRFLAQSIAVRHPRVFTDCIQWMKDGFVSRGAQEADLLTSLQCMREVVKAQLPDSVAQTAVAHIDQAIEGFQAEAGPRTTSVPADRRCKTLVLQYLEAILDGRRGDAEAVVLGAVDDGLPIQDAYERILEPAQAELGRMWHAGEIRVADEHFGSAATQVIMAVLRSRASRGKRKEKRVVAAAVGGEPHDVGIRMVADFFEMDGWEVVYLGANTPSGDLVETLRDRKADLLAVSASTALHVREVGELIAQLRADESCAGTKIVVGGHPFRSIPDLWQEVGADGSAASASEAVALGNALVPDAGRESASRPVP
jgi:methanogenic corrinoid protein MtbC1